MMSKTVNGIVIYSLSCVWFLYNPIDFSLPGSSVNGISQARILEWVAIFFSSAQFSSVQSLSHIRLFASPWIAAHQASLSITNSQSSLRLMSIESVMPSSHLILCHPLFLLSPVPPSIRIFSNESTLRMRWPKYWSFSLASVLPMNTQDWSPLEWTGCFPLVMQMF